MALNPVVTATSAKLVFNEIQLVVTDEAQAVRPAVAALAPRWRQMSNDPSAVKMFEGKLRFTVGTALDKQLDDVLDLIYLAEFAPMAQVALMGQATGGKGTVNMAVRAALVKLAQSVCMVGVPGLKQSPGWGLDQKWVDRFYRDNGIKEGDSIIPKPLIGGMRAEPLANAVRLHWSPVRGGCDRIQIEKRQCGGKSQPQAFSVAGSTTTHEDRAVDAGAVYEYKLRVEANGGEGKWCAPVRCRPLAEVKVARALSDNGVVKVEGGLPHEDAVVAVFRRQGAPPMVRTVAGKPIPDPVDPTRDLLLDVGTQQGSKWSMMDSKVTAGEEYHYLFVVADMALGVSTPGYRCKVGVPKPPPDPTALTAVCVQTPGGLTVTLAWKPSAGKGVKYVVNRRDGAVSPQGPTDPLATVVASDLAVTACEDRGKLQVGDEYAYAVWAILPQFGQDISSAHSAAASVVLAPEVGNLRAQAGDGCVQLTWVPPAGPHSVVIHRKAGVAPAVKNADGQPVTGGGRSGSVTDVGLTNGTRWHYRVCCVYRAASGRTEMTPGRTVDATPEALPVAVGDLTGACVGGEASLTWTAPRAGRVCVLRAAHPGRAPGRRCPASELAALGSDTSLLYKTVVPGRPGIQQAVDSRPDVTQPYYTAYTVSGSHAVEGNAVLVTVVADVANLSTRQSTDRNELTWDWPPACRDVVVACREGRPPAGPADPEALCLSCTDREYNDAGKCFWHTPPAHAAVRFYFTVYAQAPGPGGQPVYAAGVTSHVDWEPLSSMSYRIRPNPGKGWLDLEWTSNLAFGDLGGFVVMATQTGIPVSRNDPDALELLACAPDARSRAIRHGTVVIPLTAARHARWGMLRVKLFLDDQRRQSTTVVSHPNTCAQYTAKGALVAAGRVRKLATYRKGVPRTIMCPTCLETFGPQDLLFARPGAKTGDSGGSDPQGLLKTNPSSLWRLCAGLGWRRPLSRPFDNGGKCSQMHCPRCRNRLPSKADKQSSLLIAILGASSSGKTTYMTSLIDVLKTEVATRFDASMRECTDSTRTRAADFIYKLGSLRQMLDATLMGVTAEPLVYDLGIRYSAEELRNVSISLFDPAGGVMTSAELVETWMPYLSKASGAILLMDPLQIPAVRARFPDQSRLPALDPVASPGTIIGSTIESLPHDRTIPLAIVFSKADVLRDLGFIDRVRVWCRDKPHKERFNQRLHDDMAGMMGELVMQWYPNEYNLFSQRFPIHAFFGASATGCSVGAGGYPFVAPWRVADPLLWLLSKLDIVQDDSAS